MSDDKLHNTVRNWLIEFEEDDPDSCSILEYYERTLETLIDEAITKVKTFIAIQYPDSDALVDCLEKDRYRVEIESLDHLRGWDSWEALEEALGDTLPYLIAAGMLGHGVGLWEIFEDFPDLCCLI